MNEATVLAVLFMLSVRLDLHNPRGIRALIRFF
jgi:hypothetical protein